MRRQGRRGRVYTVSCVCPVRGASYYSSVTRGGRQTHEHERILKREHEAADGDRCDLDDVERDGQQEVEKGWIRSVPNALCADPQAVMTCQYAQHVVSHSPVMRLASWKRPA
jgi:hypothetical protein